MLKGVSGVAGRQEGGVPGKLVSKGTEVEKGTVKRMVHGESQAAPPQQVDWSQSPQLR